MVWALTPVDTVRGTQKYYIFAAGTYKVGRKDCNVIVQADTSISRVHAEIAIEKMVAWDPHSGAPASPSYVRVVDRSKYGTFVNKVHGTQGNRLHKDEDVMLTDGDTVTFGTGNATFRLSFVPMVAFFHGRKSARIDPSLHAVMASIDCNVIVQADTSISRVHAEIAIEKMVAWDPHSGAPASPSYVRVVDRSKYGTFVNKVHGTQGNRLHKDEDVMLTDGDTVTFGTGNATFRLSFVPMVAFFHGRKSARIDPSLHAVMASIGAYATRKWSDECTHVLADESCSLTSELLDAVMAKKQIVLGDWFKAMAEKNIHTEIPSCTQYIPNLTLDGAVIKMVEINLIQNCLAGYTFILGPSDKYQFGEKLHGLLESTGAKYLHIDEFCPNSQDSVAGDTDQQILVVPARYPLEFSKIRVLFPLSKISDVKLFAAILSGRLEATSIEPPAFIVTSSNSTEETIVEDSDVEMETATSNPTVSRTKASVIQSNDPQQVEASKPMEDDVKVIEKTAIYRSKARDEDVRVINKVRKDEILDISRDGACDVIFIQDLVVKRLPRPAPAAATEVGGVNFKRFRKRETVSGNSFKDLVAFAQEPYRESDEVGTVTDFMREEKWQKQMKAIAEDLFNNVKSKKRAAAGSSIHTLLAGRR